MTDFALPPTAGELLFGTAGAAPALASLRPRLVTGGFGPLSPAGFDAAVQAFSATVTELLRVDVVGVLVGGWRTHRELRAAGRRTLTPAGAVEIVEIGRHRVCSEHRPYADLLLNGVKAGTIHFTLTLVLDLTAAVATVRGGALVEVRPSRSLITVTLASEGVELASRKTQVALPGVLSFGAGYPLVRPQPNAAPADVPSPPSPAPAC
jgi:hypothetical protein